MDGIIIQQSSSGVQAPGVGAPSQIVAVYDATAQAANIGSTLLYAVPAGKGGMYRVSAHVVVTQAATTSSTLAAAQFTFTDVDTGVVKSGLTFTNNSLTGNTVGLSNASNFLGSGAVGSAVFNAQAGSNINISTSSYASSGVTPMQYAIHIKLEYIGA